MKRDRQREEDKKETTISKGNGRLSTQGLSLVNLPISVRPLYACHVSKPHPPIACASPLPSKLPLLAFVPSLSHVPLSRTLCHFSPWLSGMARFGPLCAPRSSSSSSTQVVSLVRVVIGEFLNFLCTWRSSNTVTQVHNNNNKQSVCLHTITSTTRTSTSGVACW
jgi:hypothetical protein